MYSLSVLEKEGNIQSKHVMEISTVKFLLTLASEWGLL